MPTPELSTFDELKEFAEQYLADNTSGAIDPVDVRKSIISLINIQSLKNDLLAASLSPDQTAAWNALIAKLEQIQIGTNLGFISPATPAPPTTGIYRGQASEAGTYFGGTVVTPEVFEENFVFIEIRNGILTLVPIKKPAGANVSPEFDPTSETQAQGGLQIAKRYDKTLDVLNDFFNGSGVPELYIDEGFGVFEINNILPHYRVNEIIILKENNTYAIDSEPLADSLMWHNIPTKLDDENKISKLELSLLRIGGNNGSGLHNVNLLGIKHDGSVDILIDGAVASSTALENFSINLTPYEKFSLLVFNVKNTNVGLNSIIKVFKSENAGINVKEYIDEKTMSGGSTGFLDLIKFGCVGDGVADDTVKFNQAIAQLVANGGGTVYGGTGKFKVSNIVIPNTTYWVKVEILGAEAPTPIFGTVGAYPEMNNYQKCMEIISEATNPQLGVITVAGTFNRVLLSVRNLRIKTYDNPRTNGINAYNAFQLNVENVNIDTGIYNVQCAEPTHNTKGIITPKLGNAAWTRLTNTTITGFAIGVEVYEHTMGDYLVISSCKVGLYFGTANHSSLFTRVGMYRNTENVLVGGFHRFIIQQLAIELVGDGQYNSANAWQRRLYDVNDASNYGSGKIDYDVCLGGFGPVNTFIKNGGTGITCTQI